MPDNPIKHSDIIQDGNPFDKAIKGLEELLKLFNLLDKEIKTTGKDLLKFAQKQNVASKEGQKNIQKTARATKELSEKEKESIRIKKAIEKEQAKLANLNSKEALQLAKLKEETRKRNAELKKTVQAMDKGRKSTNTWTKALGSFAAKFNTIGNLAAMAIAKIGQSLKRAINQFISFEKIIRSTQTSSDKFDRIMGRLEGSFNALNRAIALGDLSNLGTIMREAADAAEDYILALDTLGDTQNALNIQNARSRREVKELQEVYNDTSAAIEDRLTAALKAQEILNDLQAKQERIARESIDAELERVQSTFQLNADQINLYKRFIENYGLLTDEQVIQLEKLESAQTKVNKGGSQFLKGFALAAGGSQEVVKSFAEGEAALSEFDLMATQLSETLGFDVIPIMDAIVGSNDEARTSIVNSIIAYEDQIGATQRLKNANAAMLGTIKNMSTAEGLRTEAVSSTTEAIDIETEAIEIQGRAIDANRIKFAELVAIKRDGINLTQRSSGAAQDEAATTVGAEQTKQDAVLESFSVISDASLAFAEENKALTISAAIVDGIASVVATWKNSGGFPLGIAAAAAQAAIIGKLISNMKSSKFAEGEVDIDGPSHSRGGIAAEIEGGESVINKRSTAKYGNLLEAINANDSAAIADAALQNQAFHEVWGRTGINSTPDVYRDPWTKKMYQLMEKTPQIYINKEGQTVRHYPGKTQIING